MPRPRRTPAIHRIDGLPTIFPNAAGLDIGADEIVVAIPPERDAQPIRAFRTFTPDLQALVAWLLACGIDTVAMESTGVYWAPSLNCSNSTTSCQIWSIDAMNVRGRKSDWTDAQWLQKLPALGLLRASFRPDAEITALRTLVRYRAELIAHRAPHSLHMQRAAADECATGARAE